MKPPGDSTHLEGAPKLQGVLLAASTEEPKMSSTSKRRVLLITYRNLKSSKDVSTMGTPRSIDPWQQGFTVP